MDVTATRPFGDGGPLVSPLCFGTSALSSMPQVYGYAVEEDQALETVRAIVDSPVNFIDTSNNYGADGASERYVGLALEESGRRQGKVLSCKVDPDPVTGRFDGARVRESVRESLERLGTDKMPILHLHDPERITFEEAMAPDGPVAALAELRDEGVADKLGVASGDLGLVERFLGTGVFEAVLVHNRYTLLDRSAEDLFRRVHQSGGGVMNAAPFGGGILAKGPDQVARYAYQPVSDDVLASVRRMVDICRDFDVTLPAAALQFSLRSPVVNATVVGVTRSSRVAETVASATAELPDELFVALDGCLPATLR